MKKLITRWLVRHSKRVLLIGSLLGALGLWGSIKLYSNLHPDFEELLPVSARSVKDLRTVQSRLVGTDYVAVLVFTQKPRLAEEFVNQLGASIKKLVPEQVGRVEWNISDTIRFFKSRRALFLPLNRLKELDQYVADREQYEKDIRNPMKLLATEPEFDFAGLEKEITDKSSAANRFPGGYFANSDRSVYALLAYLPEHTSKVSASYALRATVDSEIAKVIAKEARFQELEIRFTGGAQDLIEEYSSLMGDVALTTIVVLVLVVLVCWLYYGSLLVLGLLVLSLLIGSSVTFGIAYLIEGYMNANSAFLGSIILGNGINFGVIFLARFVEELEKKKGLAHAVLISVRRTGSATWIAAASAALSYGGLMISDFRGFRQFGMIGFLGMACCWISFYTFLPASLLALGRVNNFAKRNWRRRGAAFGQANYYLVRRFPKTIIAVSTVITVASLAALFAKGNDLLETNMSKLRDRHSEEAGSGFNSRYLHSIFGYPHPTVILASTPEEATKVEAALHEKMNAGKSWIADVNSLSDFVPLQMEEKAAILRGMRAKIDALGWNRLRGMEKRYAKELLAPEGIVPFTEKDLPDFVRRRFQEKDGSIGNLVLVEPPHSGAMEEGKSLREFVSEVRTTVDSVKPGLPVTGQLAISADLGDAINQSGPRVTLFALIGVALFVIFLFRRPREFLPLLTSLLFAGAWLFGATILGGYKINFVNFIAVPITLGIGVDYSINILQRYRQEKHKALATTIQHSAGAVTLASLTTIIGYGALLLAGNQAIAGFGALATFGEIAALASALLTLPAYLRLREKAAARALVKGRGPAPAGSK